MRTLIRRNGENPMLVPSTFSGLVDELVNGSGLSKIFGDELLNTDFFNAYPPVNIQETKDAYHLELVAPGKEKADFKIALDGKILTISSEKKEEKTEEGRNQLRKEFSFRSFKRTFTVDDSIDSTKITAKYEKGVLHVTLPKKEEKIEAAKDIEIA